MTRNRKTQKEQTGGKILGKGLYGCAFDPPLNCIKSSVESTNGHKVGKITSKEDGHHELNISNRLSKLEGANKYFLLVEQLCVPDSRQKQTESDLDECTPLNNIQFKDTVQIIMPFGGITIREVPHTIKSIKYFSMCQHLLEAGTYLLRARVVHNDLHSMNVLCDSSSTAHFIDFGMAWNPDTLTLANVNELYRSFEPSISQVPPEVALIHGLTDYDKTLEYILSRIHDSNNVIKLISILFGIRQEDQIKSLKYFVDHSWSFQHDNWYSYFSLYWSKIDAWSLGAILLTLFVDLSMDPAFEKTQIYQIKSESALNIIKGLCEIDPTKRLDAAEALEQWAPDSPVLKEKDIQEWLSIQKKQREELKKINL
jgi:serine/threonine protein kinase